MLSTMHGEAPPIGSLYNLGDHSRHGYDDGYYLYNRRHPGLAIAIAVVF